MTRGEVWTVAGGPAHAGKPHPAVVVQDDRFEALGSAIVCPLTTDPTDAPTVRPSVDPDEQNGLRERCGFMVDKLTAVPRIRLGHRVGRLSTRSMASLNSAIAVVLGLV